MWQTLLAPILGAINKVIDKVVPDKAEALRLQTSLMQEIMTNYRDELKNATEVVLAEAKGESYLQRNWRPILMLSIVAIVVNNYLLYPYLVLFGVPATILDLPADLWNLMSIGVGGYVVGRSAEKIADSIKGIKP